MSKSAEQQRMAIVWRQRADRLSQRPSAGAGKDASPVIVLGIGKERYGIELSYVAEVLPSLQVTPVPGASSVFSGVINVHGEIRPVLDLRRLLGIAVTADAGRVRVILLRKDSREIGLEIDTVEEIRWIGAGDMQAAGNGDAPFSRHVKGATKDLLLLIRTEELFRELQTGVTT